MDELKNRLHHELLRIAGELIRCSQKDINGLYWTTYDREPYGEAYQQENEEIYNGVSGISLFFIALYRYTNDKNHLRIAEESLRWCLNYVKSSPVKYYTFYTGATGVIYALIKLYEATGNGKNLEIAEELFNHIKQGIENRVLIDDFLSGNAGNLFVITYLYLYTGSREISGTIELLLQRLTDNTRISKSGLKWGYFRNSLDSLTGLSHGASGIAHVLMEVARVLNMPALNWMADKALRFEDEYYSRSLSSWIDMRIYPEHKNYDGRTGKKLSFYLNHKKDVNAWAHGTTGMGLVRLCAFGKLKDPYHKKKAEQSLELAILETYKEGIFPNFTLSTGAGSWIELFLNAAKTLNRPDIKEHAFFLAGKGLDHSDTLGMYASAWFSDRDDPSLLLGTAGVGYIYLQLLYEQTASILLPVMNMQPRPLFGKRFLLSGIKKRVYGKYFERTLNMLEKSSVDLKVLWNFGNSDHITGLSKRIASLVSGVPEEQRKVLLDIFNLEVKRVKMAINPNLNIYREQKHDFFKDQCLISAEMAIEDFQKAKFILSGHVKMAKTKWRWPIDKKSSWPENLTRDPGTHDIVLWREVDHVGELYPNFFCAAILKSLVQKKSFQSLMRMLMEEFDVNDKAILQSRLIDQLKYLFAQRLVEFVK